MNSRKCLHNVIHTRIKLTQIGLIVTIIGIFNFTTSQAMAQKGNDIHLASKPLETFLSDDAEDAEAGVFELVRQQDQRDALMQKRELRSVQTVISHARIDRFADYTIQDALARVAGVQVDPYGEINMRGVGPDRYLVTMDGRRLASTGAGDRSFDLAGISADMVRDIEVTKVLSPDMDADAMAGVINLVTRRQAEDVEERELELRVGGGINDRYMPYTGLGSRAYMKYAEQISDDFSIDINLSQQLDQRGMESLQIGYDVHEFENGLVDVIENISPNLETNRSNRIGGGMQLVFHPSEQHNFYAWGTYNRNKFDWISHRDSWNANGGWTGISGNQLIGQFGEYGYDLRSKDGSSQQYVVEVGADHHFDLLEVEYNVGWSQSQFTQYDYQLPFISSGLSYSIDMENRDRPFMTLEDPLDKMNSALQEFTRTWNEHTDNTYTARIDLEIPFGMGSLKFGSSARFVNKDANYITTDFRYRPRAVEDFSLIGGSGFEVFDEESYLIENAMNPSKAQLFVNNSYPRFRWDWHDTRENSDIWNFTATERIYGSYGMTSLEFGSVSVMGGVRLEYDDNSYKGNIVDFNDTGRHSETFDTTRTTDQLHVFPNARVDFDLSDETNIMLAYSQSIDRNAFNQLAPFQLSNRQDTTLFRGNPELNPTISDNLDFHLEQFFGDSGAFSIGLFYKNLSDFTYIRQQTREIVQGEIHEFDPMFEQNEELTSLPVKERVFMNSSEKATIYGAEFAFRHDLNFLPGFLNNLDVFANYTWSHSEFEVDEQVEDREDEVKMPGQSPHVVNLALNYTLGRLSSQVSYHWTAEALAIDGLQDERRLAPSLSDEPIYMDRYTEGWKDVSASFRYRITDNVQAWADVTNLLGGFERLQYEEDRNYYPAETLLRGGRSINLGITYRL